MATKKETKKVPAKVKKVAWKKPVDETPTPPVAKKKAVVVIFPAGADLAIAAGDINILLNAEQAIDTTLPANKLKGLIIEAANAVVANDDELSDTTWKVLKALNCGPRKDDVEEAPPADPAPKAGKKAAGKDAPAPKEKATGRPGVLDAIEEILKSGKLTLKEIVVKLAEKFPTRPTKGLHHTAYSQVYTPPKDGKDWSSLRTKRKLTIHTNKDGQYWTGKGK